MWLTTLMFGALGVCWGANFIYMKLAADFISPAQLTLLRVGCGFVPLALVAWQRGVLRLDQWRLLPHFLVMALLATAFYYFAIAKGTALLPSAVAGVLGGTIALFTTLASLMFLRAERPNAAMVAGVLLGFLGVVLLIAPWQAAGLALDGQGVLWMLGAAALFGCSYVYVSRYLAPQGLPPLALVTWQMGLALLALLLVTDTSGLAALWQHPRAPAGVTIGLGVLGTGMAFLLYYALLERLGAVASAAATYLTPTVALAIGWANGEAVGLREVAAAGVILLGVAVVQAGRRP
ncbi:membrane protein [Pseudomonas oryzihabitans]|nr:membrane protein [Pseudomonas psychrotolerans]